jgi:hypothetical protein
MSPANSRVVLHIGMHKTGTSSIQHRLAAAPATDEFCYLDLGRGPNHSGAMYSAFASDPGEYHFFKRLRSDAAQIKAMGDAVRERIDAQIAGPGAATRVISGEDITAIDLAGLETLRDYLAARTGSIQVIAYVRPPLAYMQSAFQQRVRGGMGRLIFPNLYPNYRKRFEKFEQVFGSTRVRLMPYAKQNFIDGDVVADFCGQIGIDAPMGPTLSLNPSYSCRAISLLYTYRKFGAGYGAGQDEIRRNKALVQALSTLSGPALRFAGEHVEETLTRFREDRLWVESRLGSPLAEQEPDTGLGICDEQGLLNYDECQIDWLRTWGDHPALARHMSPSSVAAVMHEALPAMLEQFQAAKREARAALSRSLRETDLAAAASKTGQTRV